MDQNFKKSKSERGASLVEYSLLVALISIISIAGIDTLGEQTNDKLVDIASKLDKVNVTADQGGALGGPNDPPPPPPP